jgi:hypothetical protein
MSPTLTHPIRIVALAAALAMLVLTAGSVATSEARGGCGKSGVASKRSDRAPLPDVRVVVKCLINDARSASDLKLNDALSEAAQRHSRQMNRKRCFSHQCPGEPASDARIREAGYMRGASSYRVGEVIALNRDRASPRDIVRQWKNSAGHRAQIMSGGYEHIGVGMVTRRGRAFYTVTLGAKSG